MFNNFLIIQNNFKQLKSFKIFFYQDGGNKQLVKLFVSDQQEVVVADDGSLNGDVSTKINQYISFYFLNIFYLIYHYYKKTIKENDLNNYILKV